MDQTRFDTVLIADDVIRQLLNDGPQATKETTFRLELIVPIHFSDEVVKKSMTLIVDHRNNDNPVFVHSNKDGVYATMACIEPGGKLFQIDILCPYATRYMESASVTVSQQMELIILGYLPKRDAM